MKTFASLSIDNDNPHESGVVIFLAETMEDAIMAVAIETVDDGEIEDYEENHEEGEVITDYIHMWMFDDYPVMIAEVKEIEEWTPAKTLNFEAWASSDLVPLFENKFKK